MGDTGITLQQAVGLAVNSGEQELDNFDLLTDSPILTFASATRTGANVLSTAGEADDFERSFRDHLAGQCKALSTFNVAFFGRTGAGESTLLSAFGGLDGDYVSPGDSDWTTDVTEIAWHGCHLWDTPGING